MLQSWHCYSTDLLFRPYKSLCNAMHLSFTRQRYSDLTSHGGWLTRKQASVTQAWLQRPQLQAPCQAPLLAFLLVVAIQGGRRYPQRGAACSIETPLSQVQKPGAGWVQASCPQALLTPCMARTSFDVGNLPAQVPHYPLYLL